MMDGQKMQARATGRNLPISTKAAMMICAYLRGRKTEAAKRILRDTIRKHQAIPFTRFTNGLGHKKGIPAQGRYPVKASQNILMIVESVEANAASLGMTGDLHIASMHANWASKSMKGGRQARREPKRSHVWIVVEEIPGTRKERKDDKRAKKSEANVEASTEAKPAAKPEMKQAVKTETKRPEQKPAKEKHDNRAKE
jgi:large subunit ribosomal protein L22